MFKHAFFKVQHFKRHLIALFAISLALFIFIPNFAFAVDRTDDGIGPDGPNQTYWYEIGPLSWRTEEDAILKNGDRSTSFEYWTKVLYNRYWSFSSQGIDYYINNGSIIKDKSLLDFYPNFKDSYGNEVWWSWDRDYNNKYAYYDKTNDLWWSPLRYALIDPDADKTMFKLYDYIIGAVCGNITNPKPPRVPPYIYGYKYEDLNGDGNKDSGEPGLSGWTIKLFDSQDRLIGTDVTDSSGYYSFDMKNFKGLIKYPTTVRLEEVQKKGWTYTSLAPSAFIIYDAPSGSEAYRYGPKNFFNFKNATIRGRKYEDLNGNYDRNSGEPFKNGWKIILRKNGVKVDSIDTYTKKIGDVNYVGYYEFTDLSPGTYTVEEVLESDDWIPTEPKTGKYTIVVNQSGKIYGWYEFGNFEKAKIAGRKYEDVNGDGNRDSNEPWLDNWQIKLTKPDGKAVSRLTDINGRYEFNNLGPGTYTVEEVLKSGWKRTQPPVSGSGKYTVAINESGKSYQYYDFGNFKYATISGRKYNDQNDPHDGVKQPDEPYLNGWYITLRNKDTGMVVGKPYYTKFLDGDDGGYKFTGLGPGTYIVEEDLQAGWENTQPGPGHDPPFKYEITVNKSGNIYDNNDFGNYLPIPGFKIRGIKFNDLDGDGQYDPEEGEYPLNGWNIVLTKPDRSTISYSTDINGDYEFDSYRDGLPTGLYTVEEVPTQEQIDEGWVRTQPTSGYYVIEAEEGGFYDGNVFGNYLPLPEPPSSISGIKYNDISGEGIKQESEPPLEGWEIILTDDEGQPTSAFTKADGSYKFDNLEPGVYTVEEVLQVGWRQTQPISGKYTVIINENGENLTGYDFGNMRIPPSSISGIKYNDLNANYEYDPEDPDKPEYPLNGWEIRLTRLDDLTTSSIVTTTAFGLDGYYEFKNLDPGSYKVEEVPTQEQIDEGWRRTEPDSGYYEIVVDESGKEYKDNDFGNRIPVSKITGRKFEDLNANGKYDVDDNGKEPYLKDWEIILTRPNGSTVPYTTDINGYYEFDNLIPGTYKVEEVLKSGWTRTMPDNGYYEIVVGENDREYKECDFGNFENAVISGNKYKDVRGNGRYDTGDPYLEGWEIVLADDNGRVLSSAYTKADGYYEFDNLSPGVYTLEEIVKSGWIKTAPEQWNYTVIVDQSGKIYTGYDFGNFELAKIAGIKYEDKNGNGGQDLGDEPLEGWTIELYKQNPISGEVIKIDSQETAGDGKFEFINIGPGTYKVREVLQDNWTKTQPEDDYYTVVVNESGKIYSGYDFGNFEYGMKSGYKFHDRNANGVWDKETEEPLEGWTIELYRKDGATGEFTRIDSKQTGIDGKYKFNGLVYGSYMVKEVVEDNWLQTFPAHGDESGNVIPDNYEFLAESGFQEENNNFGNFEKARISGIKYEDMNGDGQKQDAEPPLKDWEIVLTDGEGRVLSSAYTKEEDGSYEFTGLAPGEYKIEEVLKTDEHWIQTQPSAAYSVTVNESGKSYTGYDFGNFVGGKISGYKWDDKNENGVWDKGEPPLNNWKITLSKQGSTAEPPFKYTDANGYYQFDRLTAGKYFVTEELRRCWIRTYPGGDTDYHKVCVKSRTDSKNNNFGNYKYGKKSGYKWNDRYPDGKWDKETEEPLSGWSIVLMKEDIVSHTYKTVSIQQTNTDGKYEFKTIHYGNYVVKEIQKDGWMQTYPAYEDEDGNLIPTNYEFFVESGFLEENNNFGNWNYGSFGKTKGYWQTWEKAKCYTNDQMQAFVDYVNANSTVYGEELFGFGNLAVNEIVDRLMTNNNEDHLKGTEQALALLEAQFLATWLNISAQFQSPNMVVHLDKVKGAEELYGAKELPLSDVIRITEENIAKYKEFGEGEIGDGFWGRNEFITAQKIFTMINEAEDNDGYIFRPTQAN